MRAEYEDLQTGARRRDEPFAGAQPLTLRLAGIEVVNETGARIIAQVGQALERGEPVKLAFLNAHCVNLARQDRAYREALASCRVLPDGVGVDIGARIIHGRFFVENLNGTDFVPRLFAEIETPLKVALVGGRPGVAERAARTLKAQTPRHAFVAVSDGYFGEAGRDRVLSTLEADGGFDVVLVAMGVPAQELFMNLHLNVGHGRILIGVGALFDFLAGNVARAPLAVRKVRLEWVWRMGLEPSRLWRRYVLGNPRFLAGILKDRLGGS
ncbi:WecB/TagA/CpsF family glycosyltransferase [Fulvimarina sp. 2208YS6-2-32]|uniref:WecB/TagA/CpsF family glycosyltransferase n=1 Tax=Fulvimarina uroteuthidis TaxID=3098149 RepID=A0ABU5HZG4_9HYPH|nr:WecB/TagA/CpsF family glycosyltransferase [Fulvimarina sp. 2208YS6-2-32]MDY8107948.1 WecB/TagA/CpsF family glycosyltransferase [Fulvimarina sp. 2208YS6-2-32]